MPGKLLPLLSLLLFDVSPVLLPPLPAFRRSVSPPLAQPWSPANFLPPSFPFLRLTLLVVKRLLRTLPVDEIERHPPSPARSLVRPIVSLTSPPAEQLFQEEIILLMARSKRHELYFREVMRLLCAILVFRQGLE